MTRGAKVKVTIFMMILFWQRSQDEKTAQQARAKHCTDQLTFRTLFIRRIIVCRYGYIGNR